MAMTSQAKRQLAATVRGLRQRLLDDLRATTEATYRLSVRAQDPGLSAAARARRRRLEEWAKEQVRGDAGCGGRSRSLNDFLREAEKQAAATLINRLVLLRLLESSELRSPPVVTGGWESRSYLEFRQIAPALARGDDSEGYAFLLRLVFEGLAAGLPGP